MRRRTRLLPSRAVAAEPPADRPPPRPRAQWAVRPISSAVVVLVVRSVATGTIVAIGGFGDESLIDYVVACARGRRMLYVPTAGMESPEFTVSWYALAGRHGISMTHLHFHPWPPDDLRDRVLDHDVVFVPGGNTTNMLAIWRVHGFDAILREAWESGVVLAGWSAGMICWFEAGVTDSFGPQFEGMELREVVAARAGATGYRVSADGEEPLAARVLA